MWVCDSIIDAAWENRVAVRGFHSSQRRVLVNYSPAKGRGSHTQLPHGPISYLLIMFNVYLRGLVAPIDSEMAPENAIYQLSNNRFNGRSLSVRLLSPNRYLDKCFVLEGAWNFIPPESLFTVF